MGFLEYSLAIVSIACIYAILTLGLNLQWGFTGVVNYGLYGVFAVGAYTSGLLTVNGIPFPIAFICSFIISGIYVLLAAIPTLRLKYEDQFAMASIGIAEIVNMFLNNERWLTGGSGGLSGIPPIFVGSSRDICYGLFLLFLVALFYLFLRRLTESPFGRVLRATREDEVATMILGKHTFRLKIYSVFIGSVIVGAAGSLYAHYITFISPSMFGIHVMFFVFIALILGGIGRNEGSLIGAFLLMSFSEGTRFARDYIPFIETVLGGKWAYFRQIIFGMFFLILIMYKPKGLLKEKRWVYDKNT